LGLRKRPQGSAVAFLPIGLVLLAARIAALFFRPLLAVALLLLLARRLSGLVVLLLLGIAIVLGHSASPFAQRARGARE
jgi:glycerol-3-phosphate acyltransferase PlsY